MKRQQYEELFKEIEVIKSYKGLLDTNPIMSQRFGADPYAMPYGDRVYFYMTGDAFEYDTNGEVTDNTYSKIRTINVVSTADMVNFEDHGVIRAAGSQGSAKWANNSWAPAAAWKNIDGQDKFFLYFANSGGGIGVLTADSPTGPFKDPLGEALVSRNTPNCSDVLWLFDPAVLVDEDGRAYLYFGGGVPEGKVADPGTARVVELGEDMISIKGAPVPIDVPYLFEDSGIHKFNNKYYYTYCTNWQVDQAGTDQYGFHNAEIVSLESDSPMGPFVFKEVILENPGRYFGLYGNNHHCVFQFQDNWYMAYHTRTLEQKMGIEKGYRCTHVDAFTIQEDGTIGKIKQTLNGREQLQYADAYVKNQASCVAVMSGVTGVPMDAESTYYGSGAMALGEIKSGAFVKVQGVDFGEKAPTKCIAEIKNNEEQAGVIQVRADKLYGEVLGYLAVDALTDGEFQEFTAQLETELTGVHDLYFIFAGEEYEVSAWRFE
ncbi:MAG: family 43 glycosylhydrolase [Lachnospiraceae bacterium]|nr:family 43 glycosylhydrolase [Lachnospiraceae bacterium]